MFRQRYRIVNIRVRLLISLSLLCAIRSNLVAQEQTASEAKVAAWTSQADRNGVKATLVLAIQLQEGNINDYHSWQEGRGWILSRNAKKDCTFTFSRSELQNNRLSVHCDSKGNERLELNFDEKTQNIEVIWSIVSDTLPLHLVKQEIHNPFVLTGDWISKNVFGTCTLHVNTPSDNPYSSTLARVMSMDDDLSGTLTLITYSHLGEFQNQDVGVFFDRITEDIIISFHDVRAYRFSGIVREQKGIIEGDWTPLFGCGTTFARSKIAE